MEELVVRIRGKDHLPIVAPENIARKASHGGR
jgi:hypothetical protein